MPIPRQPENTGPDRDGSPWSDEALMSYVLGESSDAQSIAQAAAEDSAVRQRIEHLSFTVGGVRSLSKLDASFAVSQAQRARLTQLMPEQASYWLANLCNRATEIAILVRDSLHGPAVAGYRSADVGSARMMRFECFGGTVDLRVESVPVSRDLLLSGQVVTCASVQSLRLLRHANGDIVDSVSVASDGYFELAVQPGVYTLELIGADGSSAVVPRVDLQQEQAEQA
jgi:hypothetical protein